MTPPLANRKDGDPTLQVAVSNCHTTWFGALPPRD